MPPHRMGARIQPRVTEARADRESQPPLTITAEIAELIHRQAEEARKRKKELTRRQN